MVYGCPPVDMQRREGRESTRDTLLRVTSEPIEIPAYQERCGQQCQISEGCQDLLRRLLTKDPEARIPLSQIKEHSWFTVCLPEGIHEYNTTLQNQQGSSESSTKHLQSVEWIENLIDMAASSRNQWKPCVCYQKQLVFSVFALPDTYVFGLRACVLRVVMQFQNNIMQLGV